MAVALYARVSTTRQAEMDLSIPDQLKQMRDWCESNGHQIANENVEPGASARDDKRAVFQQMLADATMSPSPYEAIIVHSLSRFFRDSVDFALYERRFNQAGVKLISITQQTTEDSAGEMARKFFSIFDEYQSKENSKHTLRAMKENARQGYFNGSRAPYGYQVVATETIGNRGRKKKKLAIELNEAEIVRTLYRLYLNGHNGVTQGMKNIASLLNQQGYSMRGNPWRAQKVGEILSDVTYIGDFYFNKKSAQKKVKPKEEWIRTAVDPIIDKETFRLVEKKRHTHSPGITAPRLVSSPILLSGIIKCGECNSGMTLMTGKSGQYRYYKCTNQKHKSKNFCNTPNIPMEKLDSQIRKQLSERVFTPQRVKNMMSRLKKQLNSQDGEIKLNISKLQKTLKQTDSGIERLYEGVEQNLLTLDETLKSRIQKLKAKREDTLIQLSSIKRQQQLPIKNITNRHIDAFCEALKKRLNDPASGFGKGYIKLLVDEIRIENNEAVMKGNYDVLAQTVSVLNPQTSASSVPFFGREWRARKDSNLRPPGS